MGSVKLESHSQRNKLMGRMFIRPINSNIIY